MFYDNLKAVCDEQGVKITPIVDECGGAKGSISNWKKGASPNSDIVAKLAVRLNVSTDLLIFGKEHQLNMNNSFNNSNNIAYGDNSKVQVNSEDSENEICTELSKIIKSLPLKERSKLITMIYDFEEQYKKSNT